MLGLSIFLVGSLFVRTAARAGDRVIEVQSRVNSALGAILPRTDYLITVNAVDALEASMNTGEKANSAVRKLPGLRVGVDERGQVVLSDSQGAAYNGPVSLTVTLDSGVKTETFKTIEQLLPEIMGGAQNADEIRVKRTVLRQPPRAEDKPAPQVVIQNMQGEKEAKQESHIDTYKLMAMFLLGLGAIFWLMSRRSKDEPKSSQPAPRQQTVEEPSKKSSRVEHAWDPRTFEDFDPKIVALYIVKCLHDKKTSRAHDLFRQSSARTQRAVLSNMPAWLSGFCLDQFEVVNQEAYEETAPEVILRELTVLEKALAGDEGLFATNFINWLPDKAMSYVSAKSAMSLSTNMCVVLGFLRPDLASQLPFDENALLTNAKELKPESMIEAYQEMSAWSSRMVDSRKRAPSIVDTMIRVINGLNTFEEIEAKLKSVEEKLKPNDFVQLRRRCISTDSIKAFNDEQKKEFLRQLDPNDFQWLKSSFPGLELEAWPLDKLMRPMRYNSFKFADREQVHASWSTTEKSNASRRVLMQLRKLILGDKSDVADDARAA